MSSYFKCLVDFNDNKHIIEINDDINSIKFKRVFNELKKIQSFEGKKISFENYSFEVFFSVKKSFIQELFVIVLDI
jgi:hypothetical protein